MQRQTIGDKVTLADEATTLLAGRYRVVRQLGAGGMGSVWLAEDVKLDGHKVAIKMLPAVLVSNRRAYQQVKQEALVSLRLSHSSIVPVRAFEEDERGNPFLVMDYVDGRTLDDVLAEKGKLSEEETLRLLKPIAAALDYAHAQGVVHRDVKPGNVMIRKDGTPFILDFGIAREIQETMTRVTGKLSSGTLMYMSPEQLHGALPHAAQDVYSFAAMVYECLTGAPPFSRGQIEYQIEHDTPASLPESVQIGTAVLAGLAKTPDARPSTCAGVLDSDSRAPRAPSPDPRAEKPREPDVPQPQTDSKSPLLLSLSVLAAVVFGVLLWDDVRPQSEPVKNGWAVLMPTAETGRQEGALGSVQLWENGPYWAECNVGATKPEEYGYYFWWGDTVGYTRNASNNGWVSVSNGISFSFSRGNCPTCGKSKPELQSAGYIDSTGNLAAPHDAATAHLGAPWRMPTAQEMEDLVRNCTTTWTTSNGVAGFLVSGKSAYSSKSIFLPAAGNGNDSDLLNPGSFGFYWSSAPDSDNSGNAWDLTFRSGYFYRNCSNRRNYGFPVRPLRGFAQ